MAANEQGQTLAAIMSTVFTTPSCSLSLPPTWFNSENIDSPINAVPGELFLDILFATVDFEDQLIPQLHTLAQVCKYWFRTILSSPRFWRVIDIHDIQLAHVVIKRNPEGPLTIRCRIGSEYPISEVLEVARGQSHRWDALELTGRITEQDMQLLDTPTPALVTLNVMNQIFQLLTFPLSTTTTTLKHVHVSSIMLPWGSPSLTGLKSLSIEGISAGGLSLRQIVGMLTASPGLEWFALRNVVGPPLSAGVMGALKQTISLPALRGLYLILSHSSSITQHLLKIIDAPKCRVLQAFTPYELIQSPGPTFIQLTSTSMAVANCIHVFFWGTGMSVNIKSPPLRHADFHDGWRYNDAGSEAHIDLTIGGIPYPSSTLEPIIDLLGLHRVTQMEVHMHVLDPEDASSLPSLIDNYPAIWDSATNLQFGMTYGLARIIASLRFLANPVVEDGRARWPCPRLIRIKLDRRRGMKGKELADAVLELLEKRSVKGYSGTEEGVTWDAPVQLETFEASKAIIDLIKGARFTEGLTLLGR